MLHALAGHKLTPWTAFSSGECSKGPGVALGRRNPMARGPRRRPAGPSKCQRCRAKKPRGCPAVLGFWLLHMISIRVINRRKSVKSARGLAEVQHA